MVNIDVDKTQKQHLFNTDEITSVDQRNDH